MVLGVIPAREGSKGVPGKNIRPLHGKPLIVYSIECGLKCPSIKHVLVTTDSPQIADLARQWGADVPYMRPKELARDTVPMLPVLQHTVTCAEKWYQKTVEALVLLDPTGPLRNVDDVEGCLKLFRDSGCDAVVTGNTARRSPYFNMVVSNNRYITLVIPTSQPIGRRQDSPPVYDLNTIAWVYSRKALMEEKARIPERTLLYLVPPERAIDLDTELDFQILEFMMDRRGGV
jgi:CMP-N,N'-diacetyllegionaminic acid synthase